MFSLYCLKKGPEKVINGYLWTNTCTFISTASPAVGNPVLPSNDLTSTIDVPHDNVPHHDIYLL